MSNSAKRLSQSHEVSAKVAEMLQTRARTALERYGKRVQEAGERQPAGSVASPMLPWQAATSGAQYAVDFAQRSILFWDTLPDIPPDAARRIGGEQEIIARYEPDKAVETLPVLLAARKDRERLLTLLEGVLADKRVQRIQPSPEQKAMLARIRSVLDWAGHRPLRDRGAVVKRLATGN